MNVTIEQLMCKVIVSSAMSGVQVLIVCQYKENPRSRKDCFKQMCISYTSNMKHVPVYISYSTNRHTQSNMRHSVCDKIPRFKHETCALSELKNKINIYINCYLNRI